MLLSALDRSGSALMHTDHVRSCVARMCTGSNVMMGSHRGSAADCTACDSRQDRAVPAEQGASSSQLAACRRLHHRPAHVLSKLWSKVEGVQA